MASRLARRPDDARHRPTDYCRRLRDENATDHIRGESTDGRLRDDRLRTAVRTQTNNMINDAETIDCVP